jgi:hypothetical protein
MVFIRGIIPIAGPTIQVSEILQFTQRRRHMDFIGFPYLCKFDVASDSCAVELHGGIHEGYTDVVLRLF